MSSGHNWAHKWMPVGLRRGEQTLIHRPSCTYPTLTLPYEGSGYGGGVQRLGSSGHRAPSSRRPHLPARLLLYSPRGWINWWGELRSQPPAASKEGVRETWLKEY